MELTLRERDINEIAYKTAIILEKRLLDRHKQNEQPEMVTTAEAARIRNVTPARMRQLASLYPEKYPHTKTGDSKQATLLFVRAALIQ